MGRLYKQIHIYIIMLLCLACMEAKAQHYFTINELEKFLNLNLDYITYSLTSNGFKKPLVSEERFTSTDSYGNVIMIDKGDKATVRYFIKNPSLNLYQSYWDNLNHDYEMLDEIAMDGIPYIAFENESGTIYYAVYKQYNDKLLNISLAGKPSTNSNSITNGRTNFNKIEIYSGSPQGNIVVKEGDIISFSTTGTVRFGAFAGSGNANGIDGFTSYNKISGFRHGALLGRIDNSPWFLIGANASFKFSQSGLLTLMINDNSPNDNEGRFIVQYTISSTPNSTTNNSSNTVDNKFSIRNNYTGKVSFELSRDKINWTSYSLGASNQSDYWYTDQQQGFFRIKMLTTKVYKIEAGKKYKIDWNKSEWCFDLFSDGDR
jgi:hypothetical protein